MGLFDGTPLERAVVCERCGADARVCGCSADSPQLVDVPPAKQPLRVSLEKRKRGKVVTLIAGLTGSVAQNKQLLKALKDDCGAGGSLEAGLIELQGDHRQRIAVCLRNHGYPVQPA